MARTRLVLTGDECIDDLQSCERADAKRGGGAASTNVAVLDSRVFERSNDRGPDGNDARAPAARRVDRTRRSQGDLIRLGQGEHRIEAGIAGRGNPRRVSQRHECRLAHAKTVNESPIEQIPCGWSFEGDRAAGNRRPGVPHRQRCGEIRVLDRSPMPREALPNLLSRTAERNLNQPRMIQDCPHDRVERPQLQ